MKKTSEESGNEMKSVQLKSVPSGVANIPMQDASADIWDKKYRLKRKDGVPVDADIDATYQRVAQALAEVETTPEKQTYWGEQFLWALRHGAIPAGRITSNAGALEHKPATSTINCTVSGTIRDSMDNILERVHEAGLTLKAGCGIVFPEKIGVRRRPRHAGRPVRRLPGRRRSPCRCRPWRCRDGCRPG